MRRLPSLLVFIPLLIFILFITTSVNAQIDDSLRDSIEVNEDVTERLVAPDAIEPAFVGDKSIMPPYQPALYHFGQDHRYTVNLRGNGEAVVYFRGAFTNESGEPVSRIVLGKPEDIDITQMSAYQIMKKPYCGSYDTKNVCVYYTDPDYYEPYSYGVSTDYLKMTAQVTRESLEIDLVEPILPGNQGAYLLFYRASGVTSKTFSGGYKYNFETFRVDDNIKMVNVGLESDPDWKFKGVDTMIDYVSMVPTVDSLTSVEKASSDSRNATFDSMVSSIGYGLINKSASGLAPMENMVVEGLYAKNFWGLYSKEIGVVASILVVFLALVAILVFKLYRNSKKTADGDAKSHDNTRIMMVISSLLVPTLATIFTVVLIIIFQATSRMSYMYNFVFPLMLVVAMISLLFFVSIFAGSAIYFGIKKGVGYGVANLFINIFIFLVLMFIMIAVMFTFMDSGNEIMPYRGGVGVMDAGKPI